MERTAVATTASGEVIWESPRSRKQRDETAFSLNRKTVGIAKPLLRRLHGYIQPLALTCCGTTKRDAKGNSPELRSKRDRERF